jgi:hypothetical protein
MITYPMGIKAEVHQRAVLEMPRPASELCQWIARSEAFGRFNEAVKFLINLAHVIGDVLKCRRLSERGLDLDPASTRCRWLKVILKVALAS